MKIDKLKHYHVVYRHSLDDTDIVETNTFGKQFFKQRNLLSNMGYLVHSIEEIGGTTFMKDYVKGKITIELSANEDGELLDVHILIDGQINKEKIVKAASESLADFVRRTLWVKE